MAHRILDSGLDSKLSFYPVLREVFISLTQKWRVDHCQESSCMVCFLGTSLEFYIENSRFTMFTSSGNRLAAFIWMNLFSGHLIEPSFHIRTGLCFLQGALIVFGTSCIGSVAIEAWDNGGTWRTTHCLELFGYRYKGQSLENVHILLGCTGMLLNILLWLKGRYCVVLGQLYAIHQGMRPHTAMIDSANPESWTQTLDLQTSSLAYIGGLLWEPWDTAFSIT